MDRCGSDSIQESGLALDELPYLRQSFRMCSCISIFVQYQINTQNNIHVDNRDTTVTTN